MVDAVAGTRAASSLSPTRARFAAIDSLRRAAAFPVGATSSMRSGARPALAACDCKRASNFTTV
jgi:hypothetical protein